MPRRDCFAPRPAPGRAVAPAPWWRQLPAQLALAWLLAALVVAPTLGRLHQVAHGGALQEMRAGHPVPGLAGGAQALHSAARDGGAAAAPGDEGLLARLLAGHSPSGCLLLDQLALGDALHGATLQLPAAAPTLPTPVPPAEHCVARHIAQFHARGPPAA